MRPDQQGYLQVKFAASSVLPDPLYAATCGYGHSGRVRTVAPFTTFEARMRSGALPAETHWSSALTMSKVSGPSPPAQWPMPGTMNSRYELSTFDLPPSASSTLS